MRAALVWCCWVFCAVALGCGRDDPRARFTPSEVTARQALESALAAWQNGQPSGPVPGTSPLVQVVDSHRHPGQKLQSYLILGVAPGDGPRVFAVRLTLDSPLKKG